MIILINKMGYNQTNKCTLKLSEDQRHRIDDVQNTKNGYCSNRMEFSCLSLQGRCHQFYSYYLQASLDHMHNYSYFLIPLFPYSPPYAQPPQQHALTLPFAYSLSPLPDPPIHQQSFTLHQDHLVPAARGQQQGSNQEAQVPSPSYALSRNHPLQISRASRVQSLVQDHNVYKYPKKNAESNLINQIFSYISIPSKSRNALLRFARGDEQKVGQFYEIIRTLKRQNKKYINRNYLKQLLMMQKSHIIHGILQKIKIETHISKRQFQHLLRALVITFLREKCVVTILTSSKLGRYAIKEHLGRRREVLQYLLYHMRVGGKAE